MIGSHKWNMAGAALWAALALAGCGKPADPDAAAVDFALDTGGWAKVAASDDQLHDVRSESDPLPEKYDVVALGWRSYPGDAFPDITDEDLASLAGLPRLKELDLSGTAIGDGGLEVLAGLPSLAILHLDDTAVTDAAIPHLERLAAIEVLRLSGTEISRDGIRRLRQSLPKCKIAD